MIGLRRLALFVSALWVAGWGLLGMVDPEYPWAFWLMTGVAPVAFVWGVGWVVAGFFRR